MAENKYVFSWDRVKRILVEKERIEERELPMDQVTKCYEFLKEFSKAKVIYGINTGFGPMAQWRVDDRFLTNLQYNIIRSHSTGAGEPLPDLYVRGAMIARLGTFLQARSGVHPSVVKLLLTSSMRHPKIIFQDSRIGVVVTYVGA
jgi:histidine ammonia-lyase